LAALKGGDHGQGTGAADKAKGAMKDAAGKIMDDKGMQARGKMDKAKGEARQALGDAKTPSGAPTRGNLAIRQCMKGGLWPPFLRHYVVTGRCNI
jgi:uncharacterized protein YjbJ (UPF0337 family)